MDSVFYHVVAEWVTSKGPQRWQVYGYESCKLLATIRIVEGLRRLLSLACTHGDRAVSGMLLKQQIHHAQHTAEAKWKRITEQYTCNITEPIQLPVMAQGL